VRTDYEFNIIGEPLAVYCKLQDDYLPHPESCLLTGITPQAANTKGVIEAEFCRLIHQQFAQPNTCVLGYNSIRFDDEFTRNCLYRNFYDPYAREWQNGNSRWDIIDLARAARALRPEGINWPADKDGMPVFKLELLTSANNLDHQAAHDALSDVYATIALAKLIKSVQPKIYDYLWHHRTKNEAEKLLQLGSYKPVVHVSGRYANKDNCLAVVLPICRHPANTNGVIVYNLGIDPEPLINLSVEEINYRLFTATGELPEGVDRIPLKTVHINKCPVLAPVTVLRKEDRERLQIDLSVSYANIEKIRKTTGLADKISAVFSAPDNKDERDADPDLAIYSGGFFTGRDKHKIARIPETTPDKLSDFSAEFSDARLPEMLFRYRARNYPSTLSEAENARWTAHCASKLTGGKQALSFNKYYQIIHKLRENNPEKADLFNELEAFAKNKLNKFGLPVDSVYKY
jgi:exodeoxyribonuclease-1